MAVRIVLLVATCIVILGSAAHSQVHPAWHNREGGPLQQDPLNAILPPPSPPDVNREDILDVAIPELDEKSTRPALASFNYSYSVGFLAAGGDIATVNVTRVEDALSACNAIIECRGLTYSGESNGTITRRTKVFLKRSTGRAGGAPWASWIKTAPVAAPAMQIRTKGLNVALRKETFTVQWLNVSGTSSAENYSFVPPLNSGSALPLVQHLGDVTLRLRASADPDQSWTYYASAWGPFSANAKEISPLPANTVAAHDITALLEATNISDYPPPDAWAHAMPLRVVRSYRTPSASSSTDIDDGRGFEIAFTLTNTWHGAIEIGGFGMATPTASGGVGTIETNIANDAHIGSDHGWVEWVRVVVDEQCVIATPLNIESKLESWRPILEYDGGGWEWTTYTKSWAEEWLQNKQWPYLWMAEQLNQTGIWPQPRSPWPSWGDGGQTVWTNMTAQSHWNPPTSKVLQPGESVTLGMRLSACEAGPRTRDAALAAVGEPVLRAVPGYTIATDMGSFCPAPTSRSDSSDTRNDDDSAAVVDASADCIGPRLFVTPPSGATVVNASSSDIAVLQVSTPYTGLNDIVVVNVTGKQRGRARVTIGYSDGTRSVAHYYVLPPFHSQIGAVTKHWSTVAWLPRNYRDPFGRGASCMPWDREDQRHRLNDGRAYDVGLSDDAGAANPLGFATSQAFAPTQESVKRIDEYIQWTLYGVKNDTAKPPFKSLQLPEPNNGIRMTLFYYNQSYFPYNYTEADECGSAGGLNYNWCMTEAQANATYRGFNYPHQVATYYSMYRTARNHDRLETRQTWQWYLERAANTTLRLPPAHIGYMDGTVFREVLRSVLEENETANAGLSQPRSGAGLAVHPQDTTRWNELGTKLLRVQSSRAKYWSTAMWPYGSEFSYDTTGQEEVVVWLLYFGYDAAAKRTVDHILSYMRSLPNWAYMGGADAGDVANGGKWLTSAGAAIITVVFFRTLGRAKRCYCRVCTQNHDDICCDNGTYVNGAGTGVSDMGKMHYRAGLNQIPLSEWYRTHPDDFFLLEIATGAQSGQLTNIDETGAPSIYYHAYPHVQKHDAYSGDYGLGFFGCSLETGSTFVLHELLGALCYLCDFTSTPAAPKAASSTGTSAENDLRVRRGTTIQAISSPDSLSSNPNAVYTIFPRDAYRQRLFLEPLGLWLQADTGVFCRVELELAQRKVIVTFVSPTETPAGIQSYSKLRLRVDQTSRPGLRPGRNFTVADPPGLQRVRSAFEIPVINTTGEVRVTISWQ